MILLGAGALLMYEAVKSKNPHPITKTVAVIRGPKLAVV